MGGGFGLCEGAMVVNGSTSIVAEDGSLTLDASLWSVANGNS